MEQHPIPQHIASFEFKLIGSLTMRQFAVLLVPLSVAVLIYFSALPPFIRLTLSSIIGIMGFIIAVVPFGGRPFDKWAVSFVKAIISPTQRIWIKETQIPEFLSVVTTSAPSQDTIPEELNKISRERLLAYLKSLPGDSVTPLDAKEQIAISRLGLEVGQETIGQLPPPIIWPTSTWEESTVPVYYPREHNEDQIPVTQFTPRSHGEAGQPGNPIFTTPMISTHAKPYIIPGIEKRLRPKNNEVLELTDNPTIKTRLASDNNFSVENLIPVQIFNNQIKFVHGVGSTRVRKLHFAPPENFDLSKLPIRGERRFEISDELKRRFHFEDAGPQVVLPIAPRKTQAGVKITSTVEQTLSYSPQQTKTYTQPTRPRSTAKLPVPAAVKQDFSKFSLSNSSKADTKSSQQASSASIIPLTSTPNVLSGLACDHQGTPIEAAVLVIRDSNGIPVRALKTNKLGQFLSATPLADGLYSIETESDLADFTPTSITLNGRIVGPINIQGRLKN